VLLYYIRNLTSRAFRCDRLLVRQALVEKHEDRWVAKQASGLQKLDCRLSAEDISTLKAKTTGDSKAVICTFFCTSVSALVESEFEQGGVAHYT
jgi:hypothetical protein